MPKLTLQRINTHGHSIDSRYTYIWVIPTQIDLTVTLTILDFFPRNMLKSVPKKYPTRNFRFFENKIGVIITQNNSKN